MDEQKAPERTVFERILYPVVQTNPFGKNRSGDRAYRRAERLAAAIFLLTNHIPGGEPLRLEARQLAMALLSHILAFRDEMRSSTSGTLSDLQATIRQLISSVRLLVLAGFISEQNAEVVIYAADELGSFMITAARSPLSETVLFSKDELIAVPDSYKTQYKGQKDIKDFKRTDTNMKNERDARSITQRGSGILGILRTGGELNIRDIAAHLPEYSEKTIQRELNALIQEGAVKRTGLRRWSRYSLA